LKIVNHVFDIGFVLVLIWLFIISDYSIILSLLGFEIFFLIFSIIALNTKKIKLLNYELKEKKANGELE
jgi:hypothetical protein